MGNWGTEESEVTHLRLFWRAVGDLNLKPGTCKSSRSFKSQDQQTFHSENRHLLLGLWMGREGCILDPAAHTDLDLPEAAALSLSRRTQIPQGWREPQVTTPAMGIRAHQFCRNPIKALHLWPTCCAFYPRSHLHGMLCPQPLSRQKCLFVANTCVCKDISPWFGAHRPQRSHHNPLLAAQPHQLPHRWDLTSPGEPEPCAPLPPRVCVAL